MLRVARGVAGRLRGLIGTDGRYALLFEHCNWIHSLFMSYPINVYYLDRTGGIVRQTLLKPWRLTMPVRGAAAVLEVPPGVDKEAALRECTEVLGRK